MKLPQVQFRGVESLGRNDIGAISNAIAAESASGKAMQNAATIIASVSGDYIERKENGEYNEQVASMSVELSQWQAKHNAKDFYSSTELGDISGDDVPRVETGTDDQGVQTSTFRDNIPAYEVYPYILANKLEGMIKDKAAKISNPRLRNEFLEKAGIDAADRVMKATVAAENAQKKYTYELGVYNAGQAAQSGNIELATFLIDQLETDQLDKDTLIKDADSQVENYQVTQSIRSTDPETVMTMRAILDDENYDGALTEEQRQGAINDLNSRLTFLDAERVAEMAKEHEMFISDSNVGIDNGTFGLKDVEVGYESWQTRDTDPSGINPRERTALRSRINARNASRLNTENLVAMGEGLINNGADWKDPDHQKAIDAYVLENEITDLKRQEEITIRSSIMPQPLENFLNTAANHNAENGSENIETALEIYGRLVDTDAFLNRELGSDNKAILSDAHTLYRAGMPADEAYAIARENARIAPELKEQRRVDYKDLKPLESNVKALGNFMDEDDSRFGFEGGLTNFKRKIVAPNDIMKSEYNNLVAVHYERTGDIGRSQKMAYDNIKETWSPTSTGADVTGGVIKQNVIRPMKYSPERLMFVSTKVANQRLAAFGRANGLDPERLIVLSDPITARDGTWAIMVIDPETEAPDFFYKDGIPLRWKGQDWADDASDYQYAKAVEKAIRKQRDKELLSDPANKPTGEDTP